MPEPSPQPLSSAALLELLHRGDEAAAAEVFERYAEQLTRLARSRSAARLAVRVDAEDIVQSAWRSFFVAARAGRFQLEQGGDLWRLLVEVTLHKLYRQAARHQAQRRSVKREEGGAGVLAATSAEPTPAEAAAAADELEALLTALSPRGRQAVALRLQGFEQAEIAVQLGCTERTVRRLLAEARRLLAARAGGDFVPSAARRASRPIRSASRRAAIDWGAAAPLPWSDYILREQIGAGASGKVYRAWHKSGQEEVAIKFLRKSLTAHPPAVERFLREAHTVAALAHPGIVAVHGAGRTPAGGLFLHLELVRGRDLAAVMQAGPIGWQQAARWVAQAARIVHFAHERGIIHCDLKPSNLLLDDRGAIRVTDFGLAIPVAAVEQADSLLAGTPAFMAPEQVDPRWGQISPRTDVYGLGAVLLALVGGRPPYDGTSVADVLRCVADDAPVTIQEAPTAPPPLRSVLTLSLAKAPALRPATAQELADALEEVSRASRAE